MDFNFCFGNSHTILSAWPFIQDHIFKFLSKEGNISSKQINAQLSEISHDSIPEGKFVLI